MAKKKNGLENVGSSNKNSVFDLIKSFDGSAEILSDSKTAVINDYISTGSYILNACMTGSLFKGVPSGRVLALSGDPGTGKTFLALSICREAQKKGYTPVYMDSEGSIDREFVSRVGCDINGFVIKQVTTISEVSTFMANILKRINEMPEDEKEKVIFVLDSLGNLTSDKELSDTIEARQKRDMTKAAEIKALFRTNTTALTKAQAPMIVCTHTYKTQDLFAQSIVSGGCLVEGEEIVTKLGTKKINDIEIGEYVLTADGSYKEVVETFEYEKRTIKFVFDDGREIECSEDHKFLVGDDPHDENNWKKASELTEKDYIYEVVTGSF